MDTIKLGIPLTQKQFNRIHETAYATDREQWALWNPTTGELRLRKVTGLSTTDQESFHREIHWDVPPTFIEKETYLTVELSLPKLWYGHNIHLLYGFVEAIAYLKELLERQFKLKRNKLPDLMSWQVWRADCCYAWRMPSQQVAQQFLDSLKHLHYPGKRPTIHPTSIVFVGATYSVKFYLKLPEFKVHDLKKLLKAKASLEWINHLEAKADGVLRYEATLRRKLLRYRKIETVGDLAQTGFQAVWDDGAKPDEADIQAVIFGIMTHKMNQSGIDLETARSRVANNDPRCTSIEDGSRWTAPPMIITLPSRVVSHEGGGFTFRKYNPSTTVLQYFLSKFIGENAAMQRADEVEAKLSAVYKPVKASRLVAVWLYVQRFGTDKTKQAFGLNSYYVARRDMKAAGVSLIESPENVTPIDGNFLRAFRMQVPSPDVTNRFDDFRDSDNLLNFVPKAE